MATAIGSFRQDRYSGRMANFIVTQPALALAIGISFLAALGLSGVWLWAGVIGNDFSVYWRTATLPTYWAYWHGFKYPFPYMPTMLLWIAPLKLLPSMWIGLYLWSLVSFWALGSNCQPYLSRPQLWLLFLCPPVINGFLTGQVAAAMAALVIFGCATRNRYAAGIAFGILASVKPQLAVMVPLLLLVRRDWRAIAASALTFSALVVLSLAVFGIEAWSSWIASLPEFRWRLIIMGIGGASPAAAADGLGLNPLPFLVLGAVAGGWIVYRCRQAEPLEMAAAIGVGSIMAAPYALTYDLTVIAPFLVASVFRGSIAGAVALSGALSPVPLVIAFVLLIRKKADEMVAIRPVASVPDRSVFPSRSPSDAAAA